jgi:hypothetical protein
MTYESEQVFVYLFDRGWVDNDGVCYRTGKYLNNTGYYSETFKDNKIYHCGNGDWDNIPKPISKKLVAEHIDQYNSENLDRDIYEQWNLL